MHKYPVSIVIPNWNGKHLLEKHLPKVIISVVGAEIVVADDASFDGSKEFLAKYYPNIKVVSLSRHRGFASCVNSGVAAAQGEIVVLINTDVVPEKNFLGPLLKHFEKSEVFAVGCLERSHEPGAIVKRGRGLAHWGKGLYIHSRGEVDKSDTAWVAGGSGAFRRELFLQLGGLSSIYNPFYWEDIDLSYTARKAGYLVKFEPKSVVDHFHEEGAIKSGFTPMQVKVISYRNQFYFVWKNCSDIQTIFTHMLYIPVRLAQSLFDADTAMLMGFVRAMWHLPEVMQERKRVSRFWKVPDREIVTV